MTSPKFDALFGGPPRKPESPLTQREMDLAASIQKVTEEIDAAWPRATCTRRPGMKNLCLAGGVALNCVGNGRILREGPFENIWIQPAAGDAGGALGAALFVWHQLLDKPRAAAAGATAARLAARARVQRRRDPRRSSIARARATRVLRRRRRAVRARRRAAWRDEQGRRLVPGPDGVRAARARRAQHPRRRAQPDDAVGDEPEDQVPRVVPAVRAGRCCRSASHDYFEMRAGQRQPVHAARRAGAATSGARRSTASGARGLDKLKHAAVGRSRRSRTSTTRRACRRSTPSAHGRFYTLLEAFERADRLPGDHQHQLQRARRADRLHARATPIAASWRPNMDALVLERLRAAQDRAAGVAQFRRGRVHLRVLSQTDAAHQSQPGRA